MQEWLDRYKVPLIFGLLGFILAVLLVTIGFFKTLLIIILTGLGMMIGQYIDNNDLLKKYFN